MRNMKLLFLLLIFGGVSFAKEKETYTPKFNHDFSTHLYQENSWEIFLHMCEKTADCLDIEAGWGEHENYDRKTKVGDNKHSCILWFVKDRRSLTVYGFADLLDIFAECRTQNKKLIDKYKYLEEK